VDEYLTNELTEERAALQAKYIAGVASMEEADAQRYLTLLEADYGAEHREERIAKLTHRIKTIERIAHAEQRQKDGQASLIAARDAFYAITDRWEAQGAVRHDLHDNHVEAWTYQGVELYRWGGAFRPTMFEMLADAQRIDAEVFGKGAIG